LGKFAIPGQRDTAFARVALGRNPGAWRRPPTSSKCWERRSLQHDLAHGVGGKVVDTLATFSRNDAKVGATPGAVGALHTHSRRLEFHPHVHMVMPAAALDARRKLWRTKVRRSRRRRGKAAAAATTPAAPAASGGGYLLNHKALAKVFRAKVLDAVARAGLSLPAAVPATWVVDCKAVGDGQKALLYLGRYLYRVSVQPPHLSEAQS
jgi:hypothetical protein